VTRSDDVIERRSDAGFDATLARLEDALLARPVVVFARIDHQANATAAGLSMPPATVLVFGAARAGTSLMLAAPRLALDLPLRILVRADPDGSVTVAHHDPTALVVGAGLNAEHAAPLQAVAELAAIAAGHPGTEERR
jgi:uncharacterized protein (DUF302 family)